MARTGLRIGEACRLTAGAIRPTKEAWIFSITDSKGDDREVPLMPAGNAMFRAYLSQTRPALAELRNCTSGEQFVFPNRLGGPFLAQVVRGWLTQLRKHLGLSHPLTPHLLRHSYATILEEAGVPTVTVMAILGHRSPITTRHYSHANIGSVARRLALIPTPWARL